MQVDIFPRLAPGTWGTVQLDDESRKTQLDLRDPVVCAAWVASIHQKKGIDYSLGGFLEDRANLLRDQYNGRTGAFIHLGVDFWVPSGTDVALLEKSIVEHVMLDPDCDGGWGGRILFKSIDASRYMIYGHLRKDIRLQQGQTCEAGDIIGALADPHENGYWVPHLHLQMMDAEFIRNHAHDLSSIDGYLPKGHALLAHVIDPLQFVRF